MVELAVGFTLAAAAVAIRKSLTPLMGDIAPYATGFVAVALATVVGGWRSGLAAMAVGQGLFWIFVLDPAGSLEVFGDERRVGLLVATASQAILLTIIALYQREVDKGLAEREARLGLLEHALREIDHRTSNNYQTVLALIHLQAQRTSSDELRSTLQQVADRIGAIAKASERMALRSAALESVRLDDHLCELCDHIERGLSREEVEIACEVSPCTAEPERAIAISIIVNELVTNALKHAFSERAGGRVDVMGKLDGKGLELTVSDNGIGIQPSKARNGGGLGTKLIDNFVRQLGADHEISTSENGTTHRIIVPSLV